MMALPGGHHLDSVTLPGQRLHLMQVDSVQRWMEDLKLMTECECMCVLQAKPISLEEDAQGDLILAGGPGPGDPLQLLLKRGWVISTELRRIGQKLAQDRWARVHSMSVRLTCHARSMVSEYSAVSRNSSKEMGQIEKLLMDKCSELSAVTERCLQVENEHVLKSMKACVSETLSMLGQHFGQLLELALTREVQALVRKIDASDNIYTTESTTGNLFSLTQEGAPLCRIIAKEGGVVALFKICRQDTFRCLYPQALRTLASICCVEEGVHQLEKVDGVLCLADILTDDSHSEATRAEAAAVVAQVTSPHLPVTQHLSSFMESMEEIVTALVKLCQEASSGEVFLLASAALANITFFDTMACEMLLQLNAIRVLLEACSDKQRVDTPYTRDQIVTILANMSVLEQCASDIIQENGVQLIMGMLSEKPRSGTPAEVAACERVQQKAAVTLARLSRDPDVAREAVRLSCMSRLIELCRSPSERNSSDAVLVACLAMGIQLQVKKKNLCPSVAFILVRSRLLCVDWLGSAPKASRTLTFSSWSSLGLWIPSYSAATWRRVLCSGCGRRKTFGCSHAPSEYAPVNTPEYTQALLILFILNLFLCEINGGQNLRATSSNSLWSLGIFFVFYFLTSVAFQLQMLKFIMANMTDCHG
ncbi:protein inscuteable homolog isoform X1 [Macaca thibetana thibetana]|uniref:protein inscuteable homolog isoform X1 n=1 Tax=Macaca thibetana thibetana TaxID=257877 RepID=UPI0021BC8E3E|nr:protein inscuteable homolog isoform X1 [Macaca thibetana thibetana]